MSRNYLRPLLSTSIAALLAASGPLFAQAQQDLGFGPLTDWLPLDLSRVWQVGDFNGDGRDDVLSFDGGQRGDVYVALSTGWNFAPPTLWRTGFAQWTQKSAIGDFNGDGRDDIAYRSWDPDAPWIYVALSTGSSFGADTGWTVQPISVVGLWAGDFDGDGRDDIAMGFATEVQVALSSGSYFRSHRSWLALGGQAQARDFNGDGKDDHITAGGVYLSDGSRFSVGPAIRIEVAGDFNGDGRCDFIERLTILSNDFSLHSSFDGGLDEVDRSSGFFQWWKFRPGDFDGDGRDDLLLQNQVALSRHAYRYGQACGARLHGYAAHGSLEIHARNAPVGSFAFVIFGLTPLNLPIPHSDGSSCPLLTDILVPKAVTISSIGSASLTIPIPGYTDLRAQLLVAVPNSYGNYDWHTSNGIHIRL